MDESNDESASRAIMRSAGVPSTSASYPPSAALLDTRGENCVGEPWVPLGVDGWLDAGLPTFDRECLGEDPVVNRVKVCVRLSALDGRTTACTDRSIPALSASTIKMASSSVSIRAASPIPA